jgi:two-component system, cell cycle sensor histidine kinase and response regulator CckA
VTPDPVHRRLAWSAARVALVYVVLGALWIGFSDRAAFALVEDPAVLTRIQTWKGWFFVLGSGVVIFILTRQAIQAYSDRERSERRLGMILDTVPSRILWKDESGRALGCNVRFARDAGLNDLGDVRGRTVDQIQGLAGAPEVLEAEGRVLETGRAVLEAQCVSTSGSHEARWIRYSVVPLSRGGGGSGGTLLCYDDVTEETRARQQLRQAQKMNEIGQLTSGLAHDFRNVLSVIRANAELVAEGALDPDEAREALQEIDGAARGATQMVTRLLGLGRRTEAVMVPTDLAEVLGGLSAMFSRLLTPTFPYSLEVKGEPSPVLADPTSVEQILLNLVTNARDAMGTGGAIRVEVREVVLDRIEGEGTVGVGRDPARFWTPPGQAQLRPGRYVAITVTDEGPGIPADTLPSVFQPFFTTKAPQGGTGLGLAMVHALMEQQNGAVQVRTAPGAGTAMRILFPVGGQQQPMAAETLVRASREVPEGPALSQAGSPVPRGGPVLVVDDLPDLRRTIARVLRRHGWRVVEAVNGAEALAILEGGEESFSLVISDLTMPVLGGLELYRELRSRGLEIPFAVMSGLAELGEVASNEEEASLPFISKPWTAAGLVGRVQALTGSPGSSSGSGGEGGPGSGG